MKKPPYTENGLNYFTNEHGEKVCTGARMGRHSIIPPDYAGERLHLHRVPLMDGGGYDPGGAYWGSGTPLYCAWGDTETEKVEIYARAKSRTAAKLAVIREIPTARFLR